VHKIVLDLRDFSRVGESEWQWTDLEKGLESTINIVWNELKYKADVERQYTSLPPVRCLASQLNQVFMNLLVNAAQAIETSGKIVIRTGTDAASADAAAAAGSVWVEVEDSGRGMSPEVQKRLFEPFYTTKPVGKGTGLGLSIAFGIVAKHHGRIEFRSEVWSRYDFSHHPADRRQPGRRGNGRLSPRGFPPAGVSGRREPIIEKVEQAMTFINWSPHFVTGIELVDRQHRGLVDLINEVAPLLACQEPVLADEVEILLDRLAAYAVTHFRDEEQLMGAAGMDPRVSASRCWHIAASSRKSALCAARSMPMAKSMGPVAALSGQLVDLSHPGRRSTDGHATAADCQRFSALRSRDAGRGSKGGFCAGGAQRSAD
jgi:hemerythrin-like metal-binding protein